MRLTSLLVCALFLFAACGTHGPLTLPPQASADDHSSKPADPAR